MVGHLAQFSLRGILFNNALIPEWDGRAEVAREAIKVYGRKRPRPLLYITSQGYSNTLSH
jgi:hypothetical protein